MSNEVTKPTINEVEPHIIEATYEEVHADGEFIRDFTERQHMHSDAMWRNLERQASILSVEYPKRDNTIALLWMAAMFACLIVGGSAASVASTVVPPMAFAAFLFCAYKMVMAA